MINLAIDYGETFISLGLVQESGEGNVPLFMGTFKVNRRLIEKTVDGRTMARRVRRTRKTKKTRLLRLRAALYDVGLPTEQLDTLIRYCRRRGFGYTPDPKEGEKQEEAVISIPREDFLSSLADEIERVSPDADGERIMAV